MKRKWLKGIPASAMGPLVALIIFVTGIAPALAAVVPNAPTNLVATPATSNVALAWSCSSAVATGYTVQRAANTLFTTGLVAFTVSGNAKKSYIDTTTAPNKQYYYRVRAFSATACSLWSNVKLVATSAPPAPQANIANLATTITKAGGNTTVNLTWTATGSVSGFTVQVADFASGLRNVTLPATARSYTRTYPTSAGPSFCRVKANASSGVTAPWSQVEKADF